MVKLKIIKTVTSPWFLFGVGITSFFSTKKLLAPKLPIQKIKIIEKPVTRSLIPAGLILSLASLFTKDIAREIINYKRPSSDDHPK